MNKISVKSKKRYKFIIWVSCFFIKTHHLTQLGFRAELQGKILSNLCASRDKMTEHVFLLLFTYCT